jgi:hypothetical protein
LGSGGRRRPPLPRRARRGLEDKGHRRLAFLDVAAGHHGLASQSVEDEGQGVEVELGAAGLAFLAVLSLDVVALGAVEGAEGQGGEALSGLAGQGWGTSL